MTKDVNLHNAELENGIDFIRVKFGSPTLQDAINNVKIR